MPLVADCLYSPGAEVREGRAARWFRARALGPNHLDSSLDSVTYTVLHPRLQGPCGCKQGHGVCHVAVNSQTWFRRRCLVLGRPSCVRRLGFLLPATHIPGPLSFVPLILCWPLFWVLRMWRQITFNLCSQGRFAVAYRDGKQKQQQQNKETHEHTKAWQFILCLTVVWS